MKWNVSFFDKKVEKIIQGWPPGIKAKFAKIVELIEELGPLEVRMPYVRPMKKGLFEIRAEGKDGIGRAMFCNKKGRIVIILSGFIKKTQKTPQNEIDIARKRMLEVIND